MRSGTRDTPQEIAVTPTAIPCFLTAHEALNYIRDSLKRIESSNRALSSPFALDRDGGFEYVLDNCHVGPMIIAPLTRA